MKKKTVKKVEKKVEPKPLPKKIAVRHTHDVVKEVQSEPVPETLTTDSPPVDLSASLPVHTPGLERC